jgi:hypothetical protein
MDPDAECGEIFITPQGKELRCRISPGHQVRGRASEDHATHDKTGFYRFGHADEKTFYYSLYRSPEDSAAAAMGNTDRPQHQEKG